MKTTTEKRLLLALLISSLVPLAALGSLSAVAVNSLSNKIAGVGSIAAAGLLSAPQMLTLTEKVQTTILILTLSSVLCVVAAAFLTVRRIAAPYRRLREKTRLFDDSSLSPEKCATDIEGISKTFDSLVRKAKSSESQLRATQERIKEFIDMSPDGIAVVGFCGGIFHINDALCRMLRRSRDQIFSLHVKELFANPGDRKKLLFKLKKNGRLKNYEVELLRGDGVSFTSLLTLRKGKYAGIEFIDVIARDISELAKEQKKKRADIESLFRVYGELNRAHRALKKAYEESEENVRIKTEELRKAYEAVKTSDRVKTDFLMQMSHELRTPLNCIIGYSEALVHGFDGPVTEAQAASLNRIANSGKRLLRMIENLLDISRIDAGGIDYSFAPVCLNGVIEDVFHQAVNLVRNKPILLELSVEEQLHHAWADQDRVSQVLFNLVENAIKFTKKGKVTIKAFNGAGRFIEVRVADTGPGVEAGRADSIFDKFVRTGGDNKSGVGLGLAISKEIITSMGGRLWLHKNSCDGCTFAFTLPFAKMVEQIALPLH